MSQGEEESLEEVHDDHTGVILGCWDHEKTAILIQDLEQSVSLVEKRCKNLFDELKYFKNKYIKETHDLTASKGKSGKLKKPYSFSETEMDITLRKNLNNIRAQTLFEKQFETKLCSINEELREAALKMGLKDNIILHPKDYEAVLDGEAEDEPGNYWCEMQDKLKEQIFFNDKSKSDPVISGHTEEAEYSKITKNELEIYQKLSKLRIKRERNANKLNFINKRQKMRFCCKKKTLGNCKDFPIKAKPKKPKSYKNKLKKKKLGGVWSFQDSVYFPKKSDELEKEKISKYFSEDLDREKRGRKVKESERREPVVEGSQTLGEVIRKTVPFTTCASTSKSYNIGVNMQQLLFLSKHGKKPKAKNFPSEKVEARTKAQTFESDESAKIMKLNDLEKGRVKPLDTKNGHAGNDEVNNLKEEGSDWEPERSKMPNYRKVRYRYTGNSTDGFMEYHKSTTSQYTNGRRSMIKSETKAAYSIGSKIMVSDCRRTQVFQIGVDDVCLQNASGDGTCNERNLKLNSEWMKFLNMCRMFTSLKEKLPGNCLTPADVELKSLESEIDFSIEKYRDFLQFYSKFLHLNHCLKSLKTACDSKNYGHVTSFSSSLHKKSFHFKHTSTKNMKKVLREVQALQDKIRLVNV